jgi:hypothetical protein
MDNFIGIVFGYSIWHFMEMLKHARRGEKWAMEAFASGMSYIISFSEKHWISQFEDECSKCMSMSPSDDELPF